jgi:hypothetical protein
MDNGMRSDRFGLLFSAVLVLSWTLVTAGIAMAIWADRASPPLRLASWLTLWMFTVVTPTLSALTIHRALRRITDGRSMDERSRDELVRLRPFLLLSANMALLSACALIFGR